MAPSWCTRGLRLGAAMAAALLMLAADASLAAGRNAGWPAAALTIADPAARAMRTSAAARKLDPNMKHLFVSTSGSDSNNGSADAPFRTIQKAASVAQSGTVVHVAAGTYNETISSKTNGTADAPIHFVSDTPKGAVIKPIGTTNPAWYNGGDYVTIEGFEVDGSASPKMRVGLATYGNHSYIVGNEVHHIATAGGNDSQGGAGILLNGSYYGKVDQNAIGNDVHHIGTETSDRIHGIYHQSTGTIANNVVHDNPGLIGIVTWHDAHDLTIANNTVFNNGLGISVGAGDWYQGQAPADNVRVINNLVFKNALYGIAENGLTGLRNVYQNNLTYGNGSNWNLQNGLRPQGTVTADPRLVDPDDGNYRLSANSPAIDRGTAIGAPTVDIDGVQRPYGGAPDIGAHEWSGD